MDKKNANMFNLRNDSGTGVEQIMTLAEINKSEESTDTEAIKETRDHHPESKALSNDKFHGKLRKRRWTLPDIQALSEDEVNTVSTGDSSEKEGKSGDEPKKLGAKRKLQEKKYDHHSPLTSDSSQNDLLPLKKAAVSDSKSSAPKPMESKKLASCSGVVLYETRLESFSFLGKKENNVILKLCQKNFDFILVIENKENAELHSFTITNIKLDKTDLCKRRKEITICVVHEAFEEELMIPDDVICLRFILLSEAKEFLKKFQEISPYAHRRYPLSGLVYRSIHLNECLIEIKRSSFAVHVRIILLDKKPIEVKIFSWTSMSPTSIKIFDGRDHGWLTFTSRSIKEIFQDKLEEGPVCTSYCFSAFCSASLCERSGLESLEDGF